MFSNTSSKSSGKHMILDIKNIKNQHLLSDIEKMKDMLDDICNTHNFTVLQRVGHQFEPIGYTLMYLLSESHISVHTFPECNYIAFDIYTCRDYSNNTVYEKIHRDLVDLLEAEESKPLILDRKFE